MRRCTRVDKHQVPVSNSVKQNALFVSRILRQCSVILIKITYSVVLISTVFLGDAPTQYLQSGKPISPFLSQNLSSDF